MGEKVAHTDPEKIWGTRFRGRFPYENRHFHAGWAAQKFDTNAFRQVSCHLTLFRFALRCFVSLCSAWPRFRFASLHFSLARGYNAWDVIGLTGTEWNCME